MKALASPGLGQMRIPDILETIADLSNDEVFTPPELANKVLDMLPESIWSDSSITFLDPATKTGIFLREITKRLIAGLEKEIPDLQERVNHILTKQVYGLGITELTTLMSRRTLYCSTTANGPQSVCTEFESTEGNIRFPASQHSFDKKGKCSVCGAGKDLYYEEEGLDNYAYSFLHDNLKEVFGDVKFDVIIGNPPYQLNVGNEGGNSARSQAIYHLFVDKAIELEPKYICMITPSRWMTKTASGIPDEWVDKMINSNKIKVIHDYQDSRMLFKSVNIRGGINYFLWSRDYNGKCSFYQNSEDKKQFSRDFFLNQERLGVVLRDINSHEILRKVLHEEQDLKSNNFSSFVSPGKFFSGGEELRSNWRGFKDVKDKENNIKYYVSSFASKKGYGWVSYKEVLKNQETVPLNKVYINSAGHGEKFGPVLGKPFYGEPNSVCSETYLVIGYDSKKHIFTENNCHNIISYIKTKFFRFMVDMKKSSQNCTRHVYELVPIQDFSKPWTDAELYEKYKLTEEEIAYIEDNIAPMGDQDNLELSEDNCEDVDG